MSKPRRVLICGSPLWDEKDTREISKIFKSFKDEPIIVNFGKTGVAQIVANLTFQSNFILYHLAYTTPDGDLHQFRNYIKASLKLTEPNQIYHLWNSQYPSTLEEFELMRLAHAAGIPCISFNFGPCPKPETRKRSTWEKICQQMATSKGEYRFSTTPPTSPQPSPTSAMKNQKRLPKMIRFADNMS